MMCSGYREIEAHAKNSLPLDPRVKVILLAGLLILILSITQPLFPATIFLLSIPALWFWGNKNPRVFLPTLYGLALGLVVLATQVFWYGESKFLLVQIGSVKIFGYQEGVSRGFLYFARILAGISLMATFRLTINMPELLSALKWFRLPSSLLEILHFAYRYVFLLLEESKRIKEAQEIRLGYLKWPQALRSVSSLGGMVFLRAFDRSLSVGEAMQCRGYQGGVTTTISQPLSGLDYVVLIGFILVLLTSLLAF